MVNDGDVSRRQDGLTANVIAVQEPWKNELQHTTRQPATVSFQLIYPAKGAVREQSKINTEIRIRPQQTSAPSQPGVSLFVSKMLAPNT